MKEKRPATPSKPSAATSRRRKTPVTETKESGRAVVLPAQSDLFASVSGLIEEARRMLARQANSTTVFLFWRIGQQVNSEILHHQRAKFGQKIVTTLANGTETVCSGADVAKALAMGADAVAIGQGVLVALGCNSDANVKEQQRRTNVRLQRLWAPFPLRRAINVRRHVPNFLAAERGSATAPIPRSLRSRREHRSGLHASDLHTRAEPAAFVGPRGGVGRIPEASKSENRCAYPTALTITHYIGWGFRLLIEFIQGMNPHVFGLFSPPALERPDE